MSNKYYDWSNNYFYRNRYVIVCPSCGEIYKVPYDSDRTYCNCKHPWECVYVPAADEYCDALINYYHLVEVNT